MKNLLLILTSITLMGACASMSDTKSNANGEASGDAENGNDVIVQEIQQAVNIENLENRLYEKAYESYLEGQYEHAISGFEAAKILNPGKMVFWKKLALSYCYIATGKYRSAQKLSKELMDEKPDFWGSYLNAGLAALWQNKVKTSIRFFEMAGDFDAHEPIVNFYLGVAYQLMNNNTESEKNFTAAESDYRDIILKNPNDEQALIELAYMNLYLGRHLTEMSTILDKAEKLIRDSDLSEQRQVWLNYYLPHLKGIMHFKKGSYHESILALGSAIEKAPSGIKIDLAETYYYLGKNYEALKAPIKTQQFFEHALELDPLVLYAKEMRVFLTPQVKSKRKKKS